MFQNINLIKRKIIIYLIFGSMKQELKLILIYENHKIQ